MAARFFNCVGRLTQAAGRQLSDAELQDIFERVHKAALDIKAGRTPAQSSGMGPAVDNVIQQAGQEAARQYVHEAVLKQRRAAAQVLKLSQRIDDIDDMKQAGLGPLESVRRTIENRADGRSNTFSLESRTLGIASDMKRQIQDTWLGLGRDFLGFVQNTDKIRLLLREMKGENTGDALAKAGAKAWLDMSEIFRQRFNAGGGDIGKLDDWALPQHHSQDLVARAGRDPWVNAVMPALDRSRYVDDLGVPWDDARVRAFLGEAWETIATNGYSKVEPGEFRGVGSVANRGSHQRQIHFRDADAYLNYWAHFGEKTFPDILMGHVEAMAGNIAAVEHYGPNPDTTFRTLRDMALREEVTADPTRIGRADRQARSLDGLWSVASGRTTPVADRRIARGFQVLRDLNVAGKLGSAFWASVFGDKPMMEAVSHLNNLPELQRWRSEMAMLNPANASDRAALRRQGLMLEHMSQALARFGEEYGRSSWSGKLANAVMRVSGMNAINEWRRGAFGLNLMSTLGEMTSRHDFRTATDADMHLLQSYGVTEFDWNVWRLAHLQDLGHGNTKGLTPDAITAITDAELKAAHVIGQADGPDVAQHVRTEAITKLLGAVNSESRYAIIEPGWRERSQMYGGIERGTWKGELVKAFWQFKTFPLAQFERMWDLALSRPSFGGKAGTLAAIVVMQSIAGAMILQTREMLSGKDPRPMLDWKFGLAAFLQGGTLGLYGDFLYSANQTRYGSGPLEALAGPTIGPALELALVQPLNAIKKMTEGKESHFLAQEFQDMKGFVPGSNLWYTKAALDHLIFQQIMEALSPGYLANMRAKTAKEYGQQWWFEPGEFTPSRPPDVGAAFQPSPR